MTDRMPPLTALRAFESAARHMSFAKAADELHVTPAALSFQIKSLEEHLGQPVFHRLNRAVALTEAGRALHPGVSDGFAALARAWAAARRVGDRSLTVTGGPGFTSKWLAPRLFRFAETHPDIDLRFSASLKVMDFDRDDVDLAIRFGQGVDQGVWSRVLFREWWTPMMSPELAAQVRTPADLLTLPLILQTDTFVTPPIDLAKWFAAAGVSVGELSGLRFNQPDHALDAAMTGAGVLLGRGSLAHDALRDGRLVMPFGLSLRGRAACRLVCRAGAETRPDIAAFIAWISQEIADMVALADQRDYAE